MTQLEDDFEMEDAMIFIALIESSIPCLSLKIPCNNNSSISLVLASHSIF